MTDHYAVLEVHPKASPEVIEKAYRALCLKHHPDRQPADRTAQATRKMQQLNAAYSVLSDPARRRAYDGGRERKATDGIREAHMLRLFLDDGLVGLMRSWIREGMNS